MKPLSFSNTSIWRCDNNQQILIHTPHLEDKYQGTRMILDMLLGDSRVDPSRVLVDHVEEAYDQARSRQGFLGGHDVVPRDQVHPQRAPI